MTTADPTVDDTRLLREGTLELKGRILPASNITFLCEISLAGRVEQCVYKPVAGERPLWDFPEGSLAAREVAAYEVSEGLGWNVVPLTLARAGPAGQGMVQLWREPDPEQDPVDVVLAAQAPPDYLHVLDAVDGSDRAVSLVHEDTEPLRRMAVFDAVVNNADRKGGHVLPMTDGHRYGVDHGVCFHVDDKLRTVLWGWADEPLLAEHRAALESLTEQMSDASPLRAQLAVLLSQGEIRALTARVTGLLATNLMPLPSRSWPSIPWPAF